ncbi:cytochrome c oxidase subunit 3 [Bacteriovoracaceae bacterium]|nr:cytochrome c oxidase subunit 3 [Bacteriovoracaceae bacterium]
MSAPINPEDIYEKAEVPSGRLAMWWFLSSEVCVFGGLLAVFVMLRLKNPIWEESAAKTLTVIGTINTLLLLTSSLFIVLAHHYAEKAMKDIKFKEHASYYLGLAIFLGFCFLGFKSFEYYNELSHGVTPLTNLFWSFYFFITGLHGFHVLIGIFINLWVWKDVKQGVNLQRVEIAGLYWHFVDVVWIFVFPLFYVA